MAISKSHLGVSLLVETSELNLGLFLRDSYLKIF